MFKKSLLLSSFIMVFSLSLNAATISKDECAKKGDNFIFAGNECVEYKKFKGEVEDSLNIIVHGTWKEAGPVSGSVLRPRFWLQDLQAASWKHWCIRWNTFR